MNEGIVQKIEGVMLEGATHELCATIARSVWSAAEALAAASREIAAAQALRTSIANDETSRVTTLNVYIGGTATFLAAYFARSFLPSDFTAQMFQVFLPSLGIIAGLTAWNVEQYFLRRIRVNVRKGMDYEEQFTLATRSFSDLSFAETFWTLTPIQKITSMGTFTWCVIAIAYFLK